MEKISIVKKKKKSGKKKQQKNAGLATLRTLADVSRVLQLIKDVWNYIKELL